MEIRSPYDVLVTIALYMALLLQIIYISVGMSIYHPKTAICSLYLWCLFIKAHRKAIRLVDDVFMCYGLSDEVKKRLVRYARNTLALVAAQPDYQHSGWNWPQRETEIGLFFGLCIPLYDDSFDEVEIHDAALFGKSFQESLLSDVWDPGKVPDVVWVANDALRKVSRELFTRINPIDRELFSDNLREMNSAQMESLLEHIPETSSDSLREISARKGIASFQLLLSSLGLLKKGVLNDSRRAAAVWAQWMDDFDDIESDTIQGSETLINRLNAQGSAEELIRSELERVTELLEEDFRRDGFVLSTMLKLSFVIKLSHKRVNSFAMKLGPKTRMPVFFWKGNG